MELSQFRDYAERLEDESASDVLPDLFEEAASDGADDLRAAIALITRERFDNIGIGKATIRDQAVACFDVKDDILRSWESDLGGLPYAVEKAANHTERLVPREEKTLSDLWEEMTAIEQGDRAGNRIQTMFGDWTEPKWVAHALLGKDGVSFGVGAKTVVNVVADEYNVDVPNRRLRALNPDTVQLVVDIVNGGEYRSSPELFEPFLPMLAKSKEIPGPVGSQDWIVQRKYDGARVLAHVDADEGEYKLFSRNAKEVTDSLPEFDDVLEALPDEGQYILDGEAIPVKDGERLTFRHVMRRFNRQDDIEDQDVDIEFRFFDLVYGDHEDYDQPPYNGDLSQEENWLRIYGLNWILPMNPEFRAEGRQVDNVHEIDEAFEQAIEEGYEGLVVKHSEAEYEFDRRSPNWRKMVQDNENVDLEIVEVIEGEDNQAGKVGALRLQTGDGHVVGKVGTGFGEEWADDLWERRDEIVGDIVEISWRELQQNDDDTYGIRFPAFEGLRVDKDEADSLDKLKEING